MPCLTDQDGLTAREAEAVRLTAEGKRQTDVAAALGVSSPAIRRIMHKPEAQAKLVKLEAGRDTKTRGVMDRIKALAHKAIDVKEGILDDPEAPLALKNIVATDILDRAGHASAKKIQGNFSHAIFTAEEIRQFVQRADLAQAAIGTEEGEDQAALILEASAAPRMELRMELRPSRSPEVAGLLECATEALEV